MWKRQIDSLAQIYGFSSQIEEAIKAYI